jgi:hypothetical protein
MASVSHCAEWVEHWFHRSHENTILKDFIYYHKKSCYTIIISWLARSSRMSLLHILHSSVRLKLISLSWIVAIFWDTAWCSLYVNRNFRGLSQQFCLATCWHAGFLFAWFSTLKMEAIHSTETLIHIWTTRRYIPEDGNIRNFQCENLES